MIGPDLASPRARDAIAATGSRLGTPLHLAEETGSTNDDAKRGAREGAPHGALWVAEAQTQGRGRQGRAWIAPRGENLLFSVLVRVACPPARVPPLALVCGLAVRDAVSRAIGDDERAVVKWPNDVLVRPRDGGAARKIAGILVESQIAGGKVQSVVIGVGINVHTRDFPPELGSIATSVALESSEGRDAPDRAAILADVLAGLDHDVEHVAHRGLGVVLGRLGRHDALRGARVRSASGDDLEGVGAGIDPDGKLMIRRDDGVIVRVASGEVQLTRLAAD